MPLVCAVPLPSLTHARNDSRRLGRLCALWEARAATRLSPAQLAHCRRFADNAAGALARASRLLARLVALRLLPPGAGLDMDGTGRPRVTDAPGWDVAFSHSGVAAFVLLSPPGETPPPSGGWARAALDAEAPRATAPGDRAFPAAAASPAAGLRRWVLTEALFKALGAGGGHWGPAAGFAHAAVGTGRPQRAGVWKRDGAVLAWRLCAAPGHWLCVALPGRGRRPARLRWLPWQALA